MSVRRTCPFLCLAVFLLLPSGVLHAQSEVISFILRSQTKYLPQQPTPTEPNIIYQPTDFASPMLTNPAALSGLTGRTVTKIELVYTTFREVDTFNQTELN